MAPGAAVEAEIPVAGTGKVESVEFALNITHQFVGGLSFRLAAPGGLPAFGLNSIGLPGSGLNGEYVFADRDSAPWFEAIYGEEPVVVPAGRYHNDDLVSVPFLDQTFGGTDPNGTWILTVTDHLEWYTGNVGGATLYIEPQRAPKLTLRKPKLNQRKRQAKLRFSASDNVSAAGEFRFACKLDKRAFKPCSTGQAYKLLKAGKHKVTVRATQLAGLKATKAKSFKIKKTKKK